MIELKKLMMDTGKIHNPQMEENTMKAEELRIGNLVNEIATGPCTANIYVISFVQQANRDSHQTDRYTGIPLTPEWLQRMGFDIEYPEHETSNYNYLAVCSWLKISSSKKSESPSVLLRGPGTLTELPHIKFIHEIQNLYFALTGEELTLKP